jgi:hypothetical protein
MNRRRFLATSATVGVLAMAGCSDDETAPPRRSQVFENQRVTDGRLEVQLDPQPRVESREDVEAGLVPIGFVGRAAAAKGGGAGRGASGRGKSGNYGDAPKHSNHGHAMYGAGAYGNDYRDDHDDDIERYDASIATVGVARIGDPGDDEDDLEAYGDFDPDELTEYDASAGDAVTHPIDQGAGWYRTGAKLTGDSVDHDFGWSYLDVEVEGAEEMSVGQHWKLSPRL